MRLSKSILNTQHSMVTGKHISKAKHILYLFSSCHAPISLVLSTVLDLNFK